MIISAAEEMNPTRRPTMEDCHVIHPAKSWNCGDNDMTYLGVYDGHGGREIVDFLEAHLSSNIAQELRHDVSPTKEGDYCSREKDRSASILERIECGFLLTDIQSYQAGLMTSGATATVCLIKVCILHVMMNFIFVLVHHHSSCRDSSNFFILHRNIPKTKKMVKEM